MHTITLTLTRHDTKRVGKMLDVAYDTDAIADAVARGVARGSERLHQLERLG